ncbi:MAG TPA: dihydroneopterin triphosphate diphosphatase [Burkholderiales bacterium]|nr:dihydroneopterin triphosphate diphosphatase [Burkholderiales bacterium]
MAYKIPISVLVIIHTADLKVLLLERADHPDFWQSVTGSLNKGETPERAAIREVKEETKLDAGKYLLTDWNIQNQFKIFPEWRHRYAPGVTKNTEHVFGLLLPEPFSIGVEPREHLAFAWLPYKEAAQKCFSWSNRDAILALPRFIPH